MDCAVTQAEEKDFRILLDAICMGFKGSGVVLSEWKYYDIAQKSA